MSNAVPDDWVEVNRAGWNLRTQVHLRSDFYDVAAWSSGRTSLKSLELQEVGSVTGKSLLHLQCHFGQDTLSWARMGATVTGCDLSDVAIGAARSLAKEHELDAQFVACNVYDLPSHLKGKFDVVFTSYGSIGWLPDLTRWASVLKHFLKPDGFFYMVDFHPVLWMFDSDFQRVEYAYHNAGAIETQNSGSYTDRSADIRYRDYGWNHGLGEIITSLVEQGLCIEFLHEFPYSPYACFNRLICGPDGNYRIEGMEDKLPMLYSIKATGGSSCKDL
jgi:SAM-dependent methyltransferase